VGDDAVVVAAAFEEEGGTGQLASSNRCLPVPTTTGGTSSWSSSSGLAGTGRLPGCRWPDGDVLAGLVELAELGGDVAADHRGGPKSGSLRVVDAATSGGLVIISACGEVAGR